jgi:hypothetical protein
VLVWPGDFRAVGLEGCLLLWWLCSQLPGSCRRAVPGPAGAPAAWAPGKALARTNELDAGKRRPMIGSEESACWLRGLLGWCRWLVPPVRVAGGVVSHAPIRRLPLCGGRHDRAIRGPGCSVRSSSAAWPAHAILRARPGLAASVRGL